MRVFRTVSRAGGAALLVAGLLSAPVAAQTSATATSSAARVLPAIRIDNFGQINENFYRGEQPSPADYADLAALGVKTVIDLRKGGEKNEQALVEKAGMKYVRIPMTTSDRPSDAVVAQFLELVNDPANQPVYVHCKGGKHRTGVMAAAYRMTHDHWTADQAYEEMNKYKFKTFWGHPELKRFVFDYYDELQRAKAAVGRSDAAGSSLPRVPAQANERT